MIWEQQDEDGNINCILDGRLIDPPCVKDVSYNGKARRICQFPVKYDYYRTREGANIGKSVKVTVWSKTLVDLCRHLRDNDYVVVLGRKKLDQAYSEKIGSLAYNIQASTVIPIKMITEAALYLQDDKRKSKELEKQIRRSLKDAEQIRRADIRYDGMNDTPFDAGF